MRERKMSKLVIRLQIGSLIYNFHLEKEKFNCRKTVTSEIHTLYHLVKGIIPDIINNI